MNCKDTSGAISALQIRFTAMNMQNSNSRLFLSLIYLEKVCYKLKLSSQFLVFFCIPRMKLLSFKLMRFISRLNVFPDARMFLSEILETLESLIVLPKFSYSILIR